MASPPQHGFRIRTVSLFCPRTYASLEEWEPEVAQAAAFLQQAQQLFEKHGYEVQTVRLVTRALAAATSAEQAAELAAGLERLCLAAGVRFLSLGATSDLGLLAGDVFSKIAAATDYTSCSFGWRAGMGQREARQLAAAIHGLEARKAGGTFRFGVSFNCQGRGIPFFPAACAAEGPEGAGFALGTENSALLHRAFQAAAAAAAADGGGASVLDAAQASLAREMAAALAPVEALAQQLAAATGQPYRGIDASIAPALEPPSIAAAYELLGLGPFGGCGTLAISERITAAIKSLPLKRCGYSGLMLPVCEDSGLAAAADAGRLSVASLLHWSAVCGCGLDTVPVPGLLAEQSPAAQAALLDATAACLLDVAALALRLDKPLSARLLPTPGLRAGERTAFSSPYLLNCAVLPLM